MRKIVFTKLHSIHDLYKFDIRWRAKSNFFPKTKFDRCVFTENTKLITFFRRVASRRDFVLFAIKSSKSNLQNQHKLKHKYKHKHKTLSFNREVG